MTTSIQRHYIISCKGKPTDTIIGHFTCSAYDAAQAYAHEFLPGYTLISYDYRGVLVSEKHGLHTLFRAEAVNHDTQMGEVIWVREL